MTTSFNLIRVKPEKMASSVAQVRSMASAALLSTGILVLATPAPPPVGAAEITAAHVARAVGPVERRHSGAWNRAAAKDALFSGDAVATGERGFAALLFTRDGTIAELYPHTLVEVGDPGTISILLGRIWSKFLRAAGSTWEIRAPSFTALIRGTTLAVDAGPDTSQISVLEGRVEVRDFGGRFMQVDGGSALRADRAGLGRLEAISPGLLDEGRRFEQNLPDVTSLDPQPVLPSRPTSPARRPGARERSEMAEEVRLKGHSQASPERQLVPEVLSPAAENRAVKGASPGTRLDRLQDTFERQDSAQSSGIRSLEQNRIRDVATRREQDAILGIAGTGGGPGREAPRSPPNPSERSDSEPRSGVPPGTSGAPDGSNGRPDGQNGKPDGHKGRPESPPGKPDGLPGKPESPPGKPDDTPGKPESPPGKPDDTPGKPGSSPGKPSGLPGKSESPPGNLDDNPGRPSSLPER